MESPWTVTKQISDITKPEHGTDFTIKEKDKVLVASGEQSFLPQGKFQTVTPCFRDEPFTPFNTKYFIKNELIITKDVGETYLQHLMQCTFEFFTNYLPVKHLTIKRIDENSHDIFFKNIELGSYGIRECNYLKWIYGTGVAEPRLTRVLKANGISQE